MLDEDLARSVRGLLDREAIRDVIDRYVHGVDRCDSELIASCYHPGAIDDHGLFSGPADEFAEFVAVTRGHLYSSTTHFLAAPAIELDGDEAYVDTTGLAHHLSHPDEHGEQSFVVMAVRYLDRFERRDDEWRIAHRKVVFDWRYNLCLTESMTSGWGPESTRGARDRTDEWYRFMEGYSN
jgi:ketosteroid isomerase-like protein